MSASSELGEWVSGLVPNCDWVSCKETGTHKVKYRGSPYLLCDGHNAHFLSELRDRVCSKCKKNEGEFYSHMTAKWHCQDCHQ